MTRPPDTPPKLWRRLGRLVMAVTIDRRRRDEVDLDLVELWRHRRAAGRRDLRRAWMRDLVGLVASAGFASGGGGTSSVFSGPAWWRRSPGRSGIWHDVRYALRLMRRRPVTTTATVLTLAVGIGASVAIFTALDRLLLQPLPYPDPERLVAVENGPITFGGSGLVAKSFVDLPVVQASGAWATGGANLEDGTDAVRVAVGVVDRGFFETMAVAPVVGAWLPASDSMARTAMLSHDLWRFRFGGDRGLVGRTITLNSQTYTVTGVMPDGFTFPADTEIWIPPSVDFQVTGAAFAPSLIARLAPGVAHAQAQEAITAYGAAQARAQGQAVDEEPITIAPLAGALTAGVRPTLLLLSGSAALLLLVICASVANLLLARIAARDREYALRRALGGTRWRIARQVLVESLLLSLAGSALGAVAAGWALESLSVLAPDVLGDLGFGAVDPRLLGVAASVSIGAALVFGAAPGLAAAGGRAAQVARFGRADTGSPVWRRLRGGLIIGQMAMALVLLTASAATLGALLQAADVDLGFERTSAVAMTATLPLARFGDPLNTVDFFERARERLMAAPGIERVAATGFLPGSHETGVGLQFTVPGRPEPADDARIFVSYLSASPDYFAVMGIPVLTGRGFRPEDRRGAPRVAVLSRSAANALFPDDRSPVGRQVQVSLPGRRSESPLQVIGVVADVRLRDAEPGVPKRQLRQAYVSLLQDPPFGNLSFVTEVAGEPAAVGTTLREAMRDVDATIPIYDIRTIASVADRYLASARLAASLVSGFAIATLIVSALGLYGVMTQVVAQRTPEIGIRLALGARPAAVRRAVVAQGAGLAAIGAAIGAIGSFGALRVFATFVPALDAVDSRTLAMNAAVLLAVACIATWLPASRASRVDPMETLRA